MSEEKSAYIGNMNSYIRFGKSLLIVLRILNLFKIRNIQPPFLKLFSMAMYLNLKSLEREILQMKI